MPTHPTPPLPADLLAARELIYDPCAFAVSQPLPEPESEAYAAYAFTLNGLAVRFRSAKTTPTKAGQFVTVWKRSPGGPIAPFDVSDGVDLFVVSSRDADGFGQFVLPVGVLHRRGIVSSDGTGGKRAFRVYPPWVTTTSRQAERTQAWQLEHFLRLDGGPVDTTRARRLYGAAQPSE